MKFHVACRGGVTINFGFRSGGGGHVKIATIKLLKIFLARSLAPFYKSTSYF